MNPTHMIAGSMFVGSLLLAGLAGNASATTNAPRAVAAYPPTSGPTTTTPATTIPASTTTPDSTTPDTTTPDSTTPDSTTPDSTTPDSTTPDSTTPDSVTTVAPISVGDDEIVAGEPITVTLWGCAPGESVVVELRSSSGEVINAGTTTCVQDTDPSTGELSGRATYTFTAPAAGTFTVTATGSKGFRATLTVVVVGAPTTSVGPLPGTGSNSTTAFSTAAVVLLLTGGGILTVSRVRRRPA